MLDRMVEKESQKACVSEPEPWFLYMLECADGSFYTGVTKDLDRRLAMHQAGKASRYTRTRLPVRIVYQETLEGRTRALVRECAVKKLSREKKEALSGYSKKKKRGKRKQS